MIQKPQLGGGTAPITSDELKAANGVNSFNTFLETELSKNYPTSLNKFTCWLNDLRSFKNLPVADSALQSCNDSRGINLGSTDKKCSERIKLNCSLIKAGSSSRGDEGASLEMKMCALSQDTSEKKDLLDLKKKYCTTLEKFFTEYISLNPLEVEKKRSVTQKYNFLFHTPNKFYSGLNGEGLQYSNMSSERCYEVPERPYKPQRGSVFSVSKRSDYRRVECRYPDENDDVLTLY